MKRNYKMDIINNTLIINKEFEKRAMDVNSPEYNTLKQLRADFPNLRLVKKDTPKRKNKGARPTYEKMVKYLSCQKNANTLLNQFTEVKEYSKAQENPYQYVRKWFMLNFPDYQKIPTFEKNEKFFDPSENSEKRDITEIKSVA